MNYIPTAKEREKAERTDRSDPERVKVTLKHYLAPFSAWMKAFSKPYTVPVDQTLRPGAAIYRGFHVNDPAACTGCGNCEEICMNKAIDMVAVDETTKKDTGLRPALDYGRCCWCGLCVDICPTGALGLSSEYLLVSDNPDDFRFTPAVGSKSWDSNLLGWRKPKKLKGKSE